eukprot:CAMPEP_0119361622 /NCGR_PEP_ID=MMETSP1334-20130426/8893_1 /TAXON_ID=127549 /ORGANISM="Calcidiscus leptoporus, Strain RCC1130" /LENGTH=51 /DNA_ID=CAMNT_0007376687 /DNA_START=28 /DNA_END=180 /DNA_ORIENTATION=-
MESRRERLLAKERHDRALLVDAGDVERGLAVLHHNCRVRTALQEQLGGGVI